MKLQTCLTILIIVACINISLECPQKKFFSCKDINTAGRFTFLHLCPKGSEIQVIANEILVAFAVLGNQMTKHLNEVIIGNHSVDTRDCQDLQITCIIPVGKSDVRETCLDYKVSDDAMKDLTPTPMPTPTPTPAPAPAPRNHIIGWSVCGFAGLIVLIGALCYKRQHVAATVLGILRYLRCSCLRNEIDQAEMGETRQTRNPEGSEVQEFTADDLDTAQHNGVISIDPTADGNPQCFSLDRNQGIQPTERGDVIVSDGRRASNLRAVNSLRDDPGGVKDNNEKDIDRIRDVHGRWTVGDRGPEDHGNEGQPLLSNQRAANQGFDMTGKAVALVDKRGFDPDQVSRCSTVPDADVESTPNMKN